jgi:hypothetical protein
VASSIDGWSRGPRPVERCVASLLAALRVLKVQVASSIK